MTTPLLKKATASANRGINKCRRTLSTASTAILSIAALIIICASGLSASPSCTTAPAQPDSIAGNLTVCYGSSQTYSISAVPEATSYKWTLPVGWTGSSTTTSITVTPGTTSGTLSVIAIDSCGSSTARTQAITVNTVPVRPGIISGATPVCKGSSQIYTIAAVANVTSYTWSLPANWSGTSSTNSITATTDVAGGTISVIANNTCGSSSAKLLSVALKFVPNAPSEITGNASICRNSAQLYSVAYVTGVVSYTWTLPGGWMGYSSNNKINTVAGTSGGDVTVTANNGCGSSDPSTVTVAVGTVLSQPSAIIGSTTSCSGSSEGYTAVPVLGATSYTWSFPVTWSVSVASTTNQAIVTTGAPGGNVSVTANNTCGSSTAKTLAVSVSAIPSTPAAISGTASVCTGSSQTYSITAVGGATSYSWSIPDDWTGSSDSTSISVTAGLLDGTISVIANGDCGNSSSRDLAVTVTSAAPSPVTAITGSATACLNSSQTYSVASMHDASSFTWSIPSGWSGSSTTNSITVRAGSSSGTISVISNNNCGSDTGRTLAVTVSTPPLTPGIITVSGGIANVCPGDTRTYVVPLTAGITYNWTAPTGTSIVSGQGTNSIVVAFSNSFTASAVLSVKATNACSTSYARTLTIPRSIPAWPGYIRISSPTYKVCPGDDRTFTVNPVSGLTYTWTVPTGASVTSGQGTNSVVVHFGNGFITAGSVKVSAANACSSGPSSSVVILRNVPSAPSAIYYTGGILKVCPGDSRTYTVANVSGLTYTWTAPTGATIASGQGTNSIVLDFDSSFTVSGYVSVTATNACTTGPSRRLYIPRNNPIIPGTIMGVSSVCAGSTKAYLVSAVSAATSYTWTVPVGATISSGQGTNKAIINWTTGAGTLSVMATNGCGNSPVDSITVSITCREAEAPSHTEIANTNTGVQVYPNPSFGDTKVQFNSAAAGTNYSIRVMDMTGRETEVKKGLTSEGWNAIDIDLNEYPKGVYFIHVQSGNTEELIKMLLR